ncbi:tRNA (uridine-2'-O-)-methyltransferase trm7 [Tilletia horrida]|nr:tRNA (uridine-2'-O-)-methyltransferase trm7 [Tilletia horrida]
MGASTKDKRDIFYRQGKAEGYRARSAYKLIHLDELFAFLDPLAPAHSYAARFGSASAARLPPRPASAVADEHGSEERLRKRRRTIVDLCAAPGSWSQVLARTLTPKADGEDAPTLIAVDLQQMAPIPHILQLTADITLPSTAAKLRNLAGEQGAAPAPAELIICDGAPDIHGLHILDEFLHSFLLRAALSIVLRLLQPRGTFIAKIFSHDARPTVPVSAAVRAQQEGKTGVKMPYRSSADTDPMHSARTLKAQLETLFGHVHIVKPASSRPSSAEHFVVCQDFLRADSGSEGSDDPLRSSLWDSVQGRDCIAACLLEGHALPPSEENDSAEERRRTALRSLLRFAAEGDLAA